VLIGSDGPRLLTERATLFTGSRGSFNFDMSVELRRGGHHSGNWGGLLANPGVILAHAIASIVSKTGQVLVRIDQRDFQARVDMAKAALMQAESQLRSARVVVPWTNETTQSGESSASGRANTSATPWATRPRTFSFRPSTYF